VHRLSLDGNPKVTPREEELFMTARDVEEYRELRATIRERGSIRLWLFVVGLAAWAALVVATAALAALPIATLLPLLFLTAVFEAVFALHTAVERIGRYIQVFHDDRDGWERTAMEYGRAFRGTGDPLFTLVFAGAAVLNFVPALIAEPVLIEVLVIGFAHALFVVRLAIARREAGRQRRLDLERFERLKNTNA
jgi:hypothetical protein